MKTRKFRILWEHCQNPDVLHAGPILYLTERNGSPKKIRPYTEEEANSIARQYNTQSTKCFHEVEEVE